MSIDAMKLALEALEHEAQKGNDDAYRVERDALRAAIEQANEFNPDWDAMAVMVEEQQRMAKRIEELEGKPNYATPEERKPVAWRKNYQNSGYTYFDERWGTIPDDAEPLFSN